MATTPANPAHGASTPADAADAAAHLGESRAWFGHPRQLARLFSTEAMERFGYYGMRALLTLYLVQHFQFSDRTTGGLYGAFAALVYLTPLVGGFVADRLIGSKRSVKLGAILMSLGYLTLCFGGPTAKPYAMIDGNKVAIEEVAQGDERAQFVVAGGERVQIRGNDDGSVSLARADGTEARRLAPGEFEAGADRDAFYVGLLLLGLSLVTVGNGFFKPNISTMVGELYAEGDRRRDGGFTIFYMGINLGSLFSQFLCPIIAVAIGWWAGFAVAAAGMFIAWMLFQFDGGQLKGVGDVPATGKASHTLWVTLAAIACVPLAWLLFQNTLASAAAAAEAAREGSGILGYFAALPLLGKIMFATFVAAVVGIPLWAARTGSRVEFQMMAAAFVLITFNVVFWTLFEQAGSSLTLFAERNTERDTIFGTMPAGSVQVFNPLFIVILAPLFTIMWNRLGKRGLEPGIPVKFGLALIGAGLGFLVLILGAANAGGDYKVALAWVALLYFIHSAAELCISPVGLSMITKLSMARVVGLMMGVWFLSIAMAQYVGGIVAQFASVETVGGQVTNLRVSLETYLDVFQTIGLASVAIGVVLLAISPLLRRWMHGVT